LLRDSSFSQEKEEIMTRSIVLGLFAFVVVAVVAESNTNAVAEDPCTSENGTDELCAFRGLLQSTLLKVNEALGSQDMEKRKSSYVRFGRSNGGAEVDAPEKRKSSYVRFGRSDPSAEFDMEKRKSAFVRFGRSGDQPESMDKRKSSYIRFGKK